MLIAFYIVALIIFAANTVAYTTNNTPNFILKVASIIMTVATTILLICADLRTN